MGFPWSVNLKTPYNVSFLAVTRSEKGYNGWKLKLIPGLPQSAVFVEIIFLVTFDFFLLCD